MRSRSSVSRCSSPANRSALVAQEAPGSPGGRAYARCVNRSKGVVLLGVWVILSNLLPLLSLRVPNSNILLTLLGVVAGVLLLVDR
jgi:hypothetical protein